MCMSVYACCEFMCAALVLKVNCKIAKELCVVCAILLGLFDAATVFLMCCDICVSENESIVWYSDVCFVYSFCLLHTQYIR